MTTTDFSKAQLATVLSALDDRPRNPANRTEALKAIGKSAGRFGLSAEDVLAAAPGLLDGRLSPADFRAELQDHAGGESADGEGGAVVDAQEPAPVPQDGHDVDATATGPQTTEPAPAPAQAPTPGERRAKTPGRGRRRERTATKAAAGDKPTPREGTKQALLISMLERPEGATVEQIAEATGWQKHTIRGAISGALKKKLGLRVEAIRIREVGPKETGAKGSATIYRIPG